MFEPFQNKYSKDIQIKSFYLRKLWWILYKYLEDLSADLKLANELEIKFQIFNSDYRSSVYHTIGLDSCLSILNHLDNEKVISFQLLTLGNYIRTSPEQNEDQNGEQKMNGNMENGDHKMNGNMENGEQKMNGDMVNGGQKMNGDMENREQKMNGDMENVKENGDMENGEQKMNGDMENGKENGRLEVILGPMFSGKTVTLVKKLGKYADVSYRVLYINHLDDNRETESRRLETSEGKKRSDMTTHSSSFILSSKIDSVKVEKLSDLDVTQYSVIGIDEGQFFGDLVTTVCRWIDQGSKLVICSGLDGDASRRPFGEILQLIPHCDKVKKLKAKCFYCLKDNCNLYHDHYFTNIISAPFTGHLGSQKSQKDIGGTDKYISLCRYHHNDHIKSKK